MRKFLTLALTCMTVSAFSQQLYFPSSLASDSTTFCKNAPALAKQIIPLYREKDKGIYYDNLFRLNMVGEDYQAALDHLDSGRKIFAGSDTLLIKGIGFHYQVYAIAQSVHTSMKV
ncbi:MAG TPA: hypothetical protein VFV08_04975, partial [Puia sp.]|nr:hypothetical protein [Puia sp.]